MNVKALNIYKVRLYDMIFRHLKKVIACTLLPAIILSLCLTGCNKQSKPTEATNNISGWVYANDPISNSILSVYDTNGNQLSEFKSITVDEQGSILISSKDKLPSDFRIVAEGGKQYDSEFTAKLCADVRNYNAEKDTIYVNLITTLISAYLDKHSDGNLETASSEVKKFLELPEWVDLPSGTHFSNEYFNNSQFISEAGGSSQINSFIENLLKEMEAGKTHPFKQSSLQGKVASDFTESLVKSAGSYVGGELMGWGLDIAGIDISKDHTAEELEKINKGMTEMKSQLTEMSVQLDSISKSLNNIVVQLRNMLKEIKHKQDLAEYDNRVMQMNNLISSVNSIRRDLNNFIANPGSNPEPMHQSLINKIEANIINN